MFGETARFGSNEAAFKKGSHYIEDSETVLGAMARSKMGNAGVKCASAFSAGSLVFCMIAVLVIALSVAGCSLDYGQSEGVQGEELPDAVFHNFEHTVVDKGVRIFSVRAEKAETYNASKRTVLENVSFAEYDRSTREPVTTGSAERAVLFTDSEDAEFSGIIKIDSQREDAVVEAEYLAWDSSEKRLEGRLDRTVSVKRGDGSWVRGAGFSADARRRAFSFREATDGAFVTKDEGDSVKKAER